MLNMFNRKNKSVPYIAPEVKEPAYMIGITEDSNHVTFKLGYTTLTMTKIGCENLIAQLEVFKNQLENPSI